MMTTRNAGEEGFFYWIGVIESLDDPKKLGRVKARRISDYDGLETDDLPWAHILLPVTSASSNQVGTSPTGLDIGSHVMGFYLDGWEKQKPIIMGSLVKIPDNDEKKHDVSQLARGTNPLKQNQVGPEPKSAYNATYPNNKVMQTKSGHVVEFDDTPGAERIHIRHKSGSYTEINQDGRRVDKIINDHIEVVVKDKTIYVKGDCNLEIKGNLTIKAKDISLESSTLKHNGVNIGSTHTHSGVETGSGTTGEPT